MRFLVPLFVLKMFAAISLAAVACGGDPSPMADTEEVVDQLRDIYIDQDNVLYVPELDGFMSILSIDGDIIATWGSPLDAGTGNGAHAIWVDSHGDLYVNQNVEGHRLVKYIRQ